MRRFGGQNKGFAAMLARGRLAAGDMNKTEAAYAAELERRKFAGEILWYKFQAIKLRLADNTFYTPDFAVLAADMVMEMHEVKGHWMDDARAKIKIAADIFPFRFQAVRAEAKKRGGGWAVEKFKENDDEKGNDEQRTEAAPPPG